MDNKLFIAGDIPDYSGRVLRGEIHLDGSEVISSDEVREKCFKLPPLSRMPQIESIRAFRRQCIVPNESKSVRRYRLHQLAENRAIDELAPKLGLMPPSQFKPYAQGCYGLRQGDSDRGTGRTTTAILRALVRLQSGVNRIIFIGYNYDQANDCKQQILRLAWQAQISITSNQITSLSARDSNLDTRLRGLLSSRSIVIDPGALKYISREVMAIIEALHD